MSYDYVIYLSLENCSHCESFNNEWKKIIRDPIGIYFKKIAFTKKDKEYECLKRFEQDDGFFPRIIYVKSSEYKKTFGSSSCKETDVVINDYLFDYETFSSLKNNKNIPSDDYGENLIAEEILKWIIKIQKSLAHL